MKVSCPQCHRSLKVSPEALGKRGKCPVCQEMITIEATGSAPASAGVAGGDPTRQQPGRPATSAARQCDFRGQPVADGLEHCACGQKLVDGDAPVATTPAAGGVDPDLPAYAQPAAAAAASRLQVQPTGVKLIPTILGGLIGAGLAATLWVVVAVSTGYEIGWLAILVGAGAGWGAALLARRRNATVGTLAAVIGAAGVVAGSYVSFEIIKDREISAAMVQISAQAKRDPEFLRYNTEQQAEHLTYIENALRGITYVDALKESPGDAAFLVLFGLLGLYYGYRVGVGSGWKQ
ncbi:MAG: hypothetical protein GVY16_08210 [Planctomycetes bacterium]|jgi:hypothetical protein|nr:hypothetical protein [Planctomycetota bacterium]